MSINLSTVQEIRRENLKTVLQEWDTIASFCEEIQTNPAYISQILSQTSRGDIGNNLARRIETASAKPTGWLDKIHGDEEKILREMADVLKMICHEIKNICYRLDVLDSLTASRKH